MDDLRMGGFRSGEAELLVYTANRYVRELIEAEASVLLARPPARTHYIPDRQGTRKLCQNPINKGRPSCHFPSARYV